MLCCSTPGWAYEAFTRLKWKHDNMLTGKCSGKFNNLAAFFNLLQALLLTIKFFVLLLDNSVYWLAKEDIVSLGQNDSWIVFWWDILNLLQNWCNGVGLFKPWCCFQTYSVLTLQYVITHLCMVLKTAYLKWESPLLCASERAKGTKYQVQLGTPNKVSGRNRL